MEPLLVYGLCALGGWLLCRLGVGENLQLPFLPSSKPAKAVESKPQIVYVPHPAQPAVDHKDVLAQAMKLVKDSLNAEASSKFEALVSQAKPQ